MMTICNENNSRNNLKVIQILICKFFKNYSCTIFSMHNQTLLVLFPFVICNKIVLNKKMREKLYRKIF